MNDHPSISKFTAFVQLQSRKAAHAGAAWHRPYSLPRPSGEDGVFAVPGLRTTVRPVQSRIFPKKRRGENKDGVQIRPAHATGTFALRAFFQDCLHIEGWTVFGELRIAPPQTLPLVLSREQLATLISGLPGRHRVLNCGREQHR
jgi:hypothetical protein